MSWKQNGGPLKIILAGTSIEDFVYKCCNSWSMWNDFKQFVLSFDILLVKFANKLMGWYCLDKQ